MLHKDQKSIKITIKESVKVFSFKKLACPIPKGTSKV